ncbi:DUF3572 family protein [Sphingopyxis witflariensis]|uniref:DUF3572 domain-containing protein n=1 Tax=Sphingopyxis witflariensis TaxID=173675 RepID=A0A2D0AN07_9SPHN|nr:DUF3572 family protein [Sphingopyxis witflariensis]OWQ94425.1 hypothetical protein CDQ91_15745 [Sphingopyxis witflariensis]
MTQLPPGEGTNALHDDDAALALGALGWILADEPRAERLLALTGLAPDELRASLGERATLAAILSFLTAHESDLIACAAALQVKPEQLAAAAHRLEGLEGMDA